MKKIRWIILIGVVLSLATLVVSLTVANNHSDGANGEVAGNINMPNGQKIKVEVVNRPDQLQITWEKLGVNYGPHLVGKVKNLSDQPVTFWVDFVVNGESLRRWPVGRLTFKGQEEMKFGTEIVPWPADAKTIEVTFKDFEVIGEVTPKPPQPVPPPSNTGNGQIFTSAPNNPRTPAEVVAAFHFLLDAGKYEKASELMSESSLRSLKFDNLSLEQAWKGEAKGRKLKKVEIIDGYQNKDSEGYDFARIKANIYFEDGASVDTSLNLRILDRASGRWLID